MNRSNGASFLGRRGVSRRTVLKGLGASGAAAAAPAVLIPSRASAQQSGVLRVGLAGRDLGSAHPHQATGAHDTAVVDTMFNGLVRYNPTEVSIEAIEPDLAESWSASDDRTQYTFKLREGAEWHRGYGEVTSADVKFSLEFVSTNPQSSFRSIFANLDRVDAPDKYTVVVNLKNPDPIFLTLVTNWHGGFVLCKKAVEEMGENYKNRPIGSGPFQFEEYRPKERFVVSAFPDFYGGAPKLRSIVFSYVPDQTARRFAFVNQEIDVIKGARNEDWLTEVEQSTPGNPVVDLLGPDRNAMMFLKTSVPPLGDLLVRKAIAYATNRADYAAFFGRLFRPNYVPVPATYFGALEESEIPQDRFYRYDLDRAKALMKEAGHADGFELETVVSEREDTLAMAQIGQQHLAQLNIRVKLNVTDHSSWVTAILHEARGPFIWASSARFPSAKSHLRMLYTCAANVKLPTGIQNFPEHCNPAIDEAYEAGIKAIDPAERARHFKEAQLLVLKDMPAVPLGIMATPVLRQGYVDLGYPVTGSILSLPYMYHFTNGTSV